MSLSMNEVGQITDPSPWNIIGSGEKSQIQVPKGQYAAGSVGHHELEWLARSAPA